jgi:hypothetical protein
MRGIRQNARLDGSIATAVSDRRLNLAGGMGHFTPLWRLARPWLSMFALPVLCPACLVTSTPSFDPPRQTPPMLMAGEASPSLQVPLVAVANDPSPEAIKSFTFRTSVYSEDNGQPVIVQLLMDYGFKRDPESTHPWLLPVRENIAFPAGTLDDGPRPISVKWTFSEGKPDQLGCHTMTLLASHAFDQSTLCPLDPNDSDQLVWYFLWCNQGECDSIDVESCGEPAPGVLPASCADLSAATQPGTP